MMLDFTRDLDAEARRLIQCMVDLNRSTALTVAILVQHGVPADAAVTRVGLMHADMMLNTQLCQYADQGLGTGRTIVQTVRRREGELIAALETSGEEVA